MTVAARFEVLVRRHLWLCTFVPLLVLYLMTLRTNPDLMSPDPTSLVPSALALAQHATPLVPAVDWPAVLPWHAANPGNTLVSARAPGLVWLAVPMYWIFGGGMLNELPASALAATLSAAAMACLAVLFARFASRLPPSSQLSSRVSQRRRGRYRRAPCGRTGPTSYY